MLTVVDQWRGASPALYSRLSLSDLDALAALDCVIATLELRTSIARDHGTEKLSLVRDAGAHGRGVKLYFTRLRKPTDNSRIESFNGCLREERLNPKQTFALDCARGKLEASLRDCREHRPDSCRGYLTPYPASGAAVLTNRRCSRIAVSPNGRDVIDSRLRIRAGISCVHQPDRALATGVTDSERSSRCVKRSICRRA